MAAKLARSQRTASRESAPESGRSLLKVGDLLASKYRVERLLGEGGMGLVVEAYHELLDQRVAVKLLYQDIADREAQSRLLLEARSAAKLQSEHVARVVDVDVGADGLPFIVMELLEGADLCQVADARGALPRWLVVDYVLQALEGLAHAHGRGIIHRDLKPSNLFLANKPDGTQVIKILDFGISKSADAQDKRRQQLTGGRTVLGSPPYMSPEQVRRPKTVDHRTDIWSLGICMYELLTNSMPFGGDEMQETFAQILEKEPTPIRSLVTGVPEGLEHIVMRCLAKNREERFADVAELAKALVPYGSGTWMQSADRVQATLARALMDDLASGSRIRNVGGVSSDRIAIPSGPARRIDSIQPELHGTASTVARRFTAFDSKRRWIVAGIAIPAALGLVLIGVTTFTNGSRPATGAAGDLEVAPPAPVVEAPPAPTFVAPLTVQTASVENDLPPPVQGTLLGASPMPAPVPVPPPVTTAAAAPPAKAGRSSAPVSTGRATPAPPRSAAKPAATPAAKTLPAGLPQTRSGQ
ncbi:MAG: serine/threonine protein kinase [Labilithrix sp.]|nr:serine/threonine protein kinase [Labilithrix sp.]MBX3223997.1 serine/threonine protein kinase [Labilithrix sp.]